MMEYQGYIGKVEMDDEADILYGEVINVRNVITFRVFRSKKFSRLLTSQLIII